MYQRLRWGKNIHEYWHFFKGHSYFNKYGGKLIFECNLSENDINNYLKKCFLWDILNAWRNIFKPQLPSISYSSIIWNNSSIRSRHKSLFYRTWLEKGILSYGDIFDLRTHFTHLTHLTWYKTYTVYQILTTWNIYR